MSDLLQALDAVIAERRRALEGSAKTKRPTLIKSKKFGGDT